MYGVQTQGQDGKMRTDWVGLIVGGLLPFAAAGAGLLAVICLAYYLVGCG